MDRDIQSVEDAPVLILVQAVLSSGIMATKPQGVCRGIDVEVLG